ncbi:MAG TPA: hypothetical protein PLK06_03405 [bacterium]|nr:hypothetical protein [bacterium]
MKKTLLILPALIILLGVGGTATVYARDFGQIEDLTAEQQASLSTVKELLDQGKFDEAEKLAADAGLPELKHGMRMHLDPEKKQALDAALDSGDYTAFVTLSADAPFADDLTPEIFAQLVEAHTRMEANDVDGAREILDGLDLQIPIPGGHRGFHEGREHELMELTDEEKNLLDQAHTLRESGDEEGARAILESLDLPQPPMRAFHR